MAETNLNLRRCSVDPPISALVGGMAIGAQTRIDGAPHQPIQQAWQQERRDMMSHCSHTRWGQVGQVHGYPCHSNLSIRTRVPTLCVLGGSLGGNPSSGLSSLLVCVFCSGVGDPRNPKSEAWTSVNQERYVLLGQLGAMPYPCRRPPRLLPPSQMLSTSVCPPGSLLDGR